MVNQFLKSKRVVTTFDPYVFTSFVSGWVLLRDPNLRPVHLYHCSFLTFLRFWVFDVNESS